MRERLPCGPVAEALPFHCRGHGFSPQPGNKGPKRQVVLPMNKWNAMQDITLVSFRIDCTSTDVSDTLRQIKYALKCISLVSSLFQCDYWKKENYMCRSYYIPVGEH